MTKKGERVAGTIEAEDKNEAIRSIERVGRFPIAITAAEGNPPEHEPTPATPPSLGVKAFRLVTRPIAVTMGIFLLYVAASTVWKAFALRIGGQIVEARIASQGENGVKYRFRRSPAGPEYYYKQLGREVWCRPVGIQTGDTISVRYVSWNPFLNQPSARPILTGDDIFGILFSSLLGSLPFLLIYLNYVPAIRARKADPLWFLDGYGVLMGSGGLLGFLASAAGPGVAIVVGVVLLLALLRRFASADGEPAKESQTAQGLHILKKDERGEFHESRGDVSDVHALMSLAQIPFNSVMAASRANNILPRHEKELLEAVDLLTKVIELYSERGEPYGQRASMYFIYAQVNKDRSYLDKAENDYRKALAVGGSDPSNHSIWRENLSQIAMVRGML